MALSKSQRLLISSYPVIQKVRMKPIEVRLVDKSENKACMIIPKRYVAKACDRNRIRRCCLEFTRKAFKKHQIGSIIIKVYTQPEDSTELVSILSKCINQLRC